MRKYASSFLLMVLLCVGGAVSQAANVGAPTPNAARVLAARDHGVVYFLPDEKTSDAKVLAELSRIKGEGYTHINFASWTWTLPKNGTEFRRRVDLVLNWCDVNDFGFWLLHNLQYGTPDAGDFEEAAKNPVAYVRPVVVDWIEALRGHKCVRGVQLGNEVGPVIPADTAKTPVYMAAFRTWLQSRFGNIGALNAAWKTDFASLANVEMPKESDAGRIDAQRFANAQFGIFYGTIFRELFKPALGQIGYTTKTSPDPYVYRAFPEATVLGWDDLLANHPLWTLRVLTDTDSRPAFNNEIHLYHEGFHFGPSVELTRYRYFTDALTGQWKNSSFAWNQWNKPEIQTIHAATPRVMADLNRLETPLRRFNIATKNARIGVLVTEPLFSQSARNIAERPLLQTGETATQNAMQTEVKNEVPLEAAYAALAATGRNWRFVLDSDIALQAKKLDILIVPSHRQMPLKTLRALVALPHRVKIEWAGAAAQADEYGNALPAADLRALRNRVVFRTTLKDAARVLADEKLAPFYRQSAIVPYLWYSPQRGHYTFGVEIPRLEARRVFDDKRRLLVALVNHTKEEIALPQDVLFPWQERKQKAFDITKNLPAVASRVLAPLETRLLRYQ